MEVTVDNHLGQVVQRVSYQPFGEFASALTSSDVKAGPVPTDGAALHHYFTGQALDGETVCIT